MFEAIDHSPHAHPASPTDSLPESFASYRTRATQHGPLGGGSGRAAPQQQQSSPKPSASGSAASTAGASGYQVQPYGAVGGHSGQQLGSVQPAEGEVWDRDELPLRFRRKIYSKAEIDAVDSAGASLWG